MDDSDDRLWQHVTVRVDVDGWFELCLDKATHKFPTYSHLWTYAKQHYYLELPVNFATKLMGFDIPREEEDGS